MAQVTPDKYSPYPRVCDICGQLRSINTMRKLDNVTFVCDKHEGERTRIMLDILNADARPPQTWPTENPKPQNPLYPNLLQADEGELFNFIDQQITNGARYENVTAGDGAPIAQDIVPTMAWAGRYLYTLIVQDTLPVRFIERGKVLLATAADYLASRQRGFGIASSGVSSDPWFGGILESGASTYVTDDTSAGGLALLYAYRILGTGSYLASARAAASYLRNVQAIGRYGAQYTSSDSVGTARLYTGAVASEVSTAIGVDAGDLFYSTHCFYPSGLLALQFWKELTTTDGDQAIGCTGTGTDAFVSAPAQLMSTSMTDMRTCWEDGIRDSVGETYTGLSATTPREFFNAYPATKAEFSSITGTGRWEFQDGAAATGTLVSGLNVATALGALYAYEGASTQVTGVFDWLQTFESNEDFETQDDTSDSVLARSTTGEYDATAGIATLLLVRDADDSYASIALNGSSIYDWGAFGVLAPLWASRNLSTFKSARINPLNVRQRYDDGRLTDGLFYDRIQLRGTSGLTLQTAFAIDLYAGNVGIAQSAIRSGQGVNLDWNGGAMTVPAGQLANFESFTFTTISDSDSANTFPYIDEGGGECPNGAMVRLENKTGSPRTFNHMAGSIAGQLQCFIVTTGTIPDGGSINFVRDDELGAWLQVSPAVVNDAVRAAMFGATYRGPK